ncbi:MAG: PH domain-containing protein [Chloroflexi bacterium]|nr:PH domain-containing protein [Chloroflexota bacterium]
MATKAMRFPLGSLSADEDGVTISGTGDSKVIAYDQIRAVSTKFMGKVVRIETGPKCTA